MHFDFDKIFKKKLKLPMIANNTHIKKTISKPKLLTQIKGKMRTGDYSLYFSYEIVFSGC